MKKHHLAVLLILVLVTLLVWKDSAKAHFQCLFPSTDVINQDTGKRISLNMLFNHPMEGPLMNMVKPTKFGVYFKGEKFEDLSASLVERKIENFSTWTAEYDVKKPGDHIFFVEPSPYWEPAEDCMIVHYTKVCVNGYGDEEGWDAELGVKTEIVPLVRPYGLWAGNTFSGIVKLDGKPVPYAEIEVEFYNEDKSVKWPTEAHITQVIKADSNGVFHYSMPKAGWWAFAALNTADYQLKNPAGEMKDVELGAVYWVKTYEMK